MYTSRLRIISAIGILLCLSFVQPHLYQFQQPDIFPKLKQPADNIATIEGVELGRFLFYDPVLSRDSTFSCNSCHHQNAAFSDGGKQFTKGISGDMMKRNTPPLFNLAWHTSFFWDGRAKTLEEQVFHPVRSTNEMDMQWNKVEARLRGSKFYRNKFDAAFPGKQIDSVLVSKALAQFIRTLISADSKYDKVITGEAEYSHDEYEGFVLINDQTRGNCQHCHVTDGNGLGTRVNFSNNGLDSAYTLSGYKDVGRGAVTGNPDDYGKFKVPSLRNVAVTAPYMHDGRFKTLEEVIDFYSEGVHASINVDPKMAEVNKGGMHLTKEEKRKIVAFLKSFTDSSFITNPAFGNPF